jgi:hypothetical protein
MILSYVPPAYSMAGLIPRSRRRGAAKVVAGAVPLALALNIAFLMVGLFVWPPPRNTWAFVAIELPRRAWTALVGG